MTETSIPTNPTESTYIESISDPFFKTIAELVIPPSVSDDNDNLKPAAIRLDDLEVTIRKHLFEILLSDGGDDDVKEIVSKVGSYWKSTLDLCHHLVYYATNGIG